MEHSKVKLTRKVADGYVIPLGPANLVMVRTDFGMVVCGAFDVAAPRLVHVPRREGASLPRAINCGY